MEQGREKNSTVYLAQDPQASSLLARTAPRVVVTSVKDFDVHWRRQIRNNVVVDCSSGEHVKSLLWCEGGSERCGVKSILGMLGGCGVASANGVEISWSDLSLFSPPAPAPAIDLSPWRTLTGRDDVKRDTIVPASPRRSQSLEEDVARPPRRLEIRIPDRPGNPPNARAFYH